MTKRYLLGVAPLLAVLACPPQLSGEPCEGPSNNDCPTGQACVSAGDGGFVCVDGAGGQTPDGGDGGLDSGFDAGPTFAGTVVLNGQAAPERRTWVYGLASSASFTDAGIVNPAFLTTADDAGAWSVTGPATDGSYYFVAQYDIAGDADAGQLNGGIFSAGVVSAVGQSNALNLALDVETSTCFSITAEIQFTANVSLTVLLGVGAQVPDIQTNQPLTDLTTATVNFDAGGADFPDASVPPPTLVLKQGASVPGNPFANDWIFGEPAGNTQLLSNQGSFTFTLSDSDAQARVPEYPSGSCQVGYSDPPGFPSNVMVNPGSVVASNEIVSWTDPPPPSEANATFFGDLIYVFDSTGAQIYSTPANQLATSPTTLHSSDFTTAPDCRSTTLTKYCSAEVVSMFAVARDSRSTAFEGGTVFKAFQVQ